MKQLFDNGPRTRGSIKESGESDYNFLNTSAWPWVDYVRHVLNDWYSQFPDDGQLSANIKSKDRQNHKSAFFELFTYHLFKGMGFSVDYHVPIGNRLIDIKATKDDFTIWCDCVLSGEPNANSSILRNEGTIEDMIEKLHSPDYWLNIRFESMSKSTPSQRKLRSAIDRKLIELRLTNTPAERLTYEDAGWIIKIIFTKKTPPTACPVGSVVSSQHSGFNDGPSMDILRRSLDAKRGSGYGVEGRYVIALNSANVLLNESILIATLFGSGMEESMVSDLSIPHPFFFVDSPQNTSVSGLLLVRDLGDANMGQVGIELWHNPWAKFSLPTNDLPCRQVLPLLNSKNSITELSKIEGLPTHKLLNIEQNYLYRDRHEDDF